MLLLRATVVKKNQGVSPDKMLWVTRTLRASCTLSSARTVTTLSTLPTFRTLVFRRNSRMEALEEAMLGSILARLGVGEGM